MITFDPKEISQKELHAHLLGAVAPRPIAFASTIDAGGRPNLSPFSFFNVFSSNPPVLIFSPARRGRDATTKHTLDNLEEVKEVVINIVSYNMVDQVVLASTEYERGVNEFGKAGLKAIPSEKVKPFRVVQSPVQLECKVNEVIALGEGSGSGNLVICEVLLIHIDESILNEKGRIDPVKLDNVGRMGDLYYTRAAKGLFEIATPRGNDNISMENLPGFIKNSRYFTENEKARLAKQNGFPSKEEVEMVRNSTGMQEIYEHYGHDEVMIEAKLHNLAKELLEENKIDEAWKVLLSNKDNY